MCRDKYTNQNTSSVAVCKIIVLHSYTDSRKRDDEWTKHEQNDGEHHQLASGVRVQRQHDTLSSIVTVSDVNVLYTWRQARRHLLLLSTRIHHDDVTT